MAKIVDPDSLNQATEVVFSVGAKTIQLLVAGNLDDNSPGKTSGVTGKALYSFCKEEWETDNTLNKYRFPINMIYEASFILINGWTFADDQTRDLLRDAGFREEVLNDEYACIISLGDIDNPSVDQAYYQNIIGFDQTTTDFDKTGELNENIQIFDGTLDYRDFLKNYLREYQKLYAEYNLLVEQGLSALTYQAYRLPLGGNTTDLKIQNNDAYVDANTPYTGMDINFIKGSGFTTWANTTVYPAGAVVLDANRQSGGSSNGTWWFTPTGGTSNGTGTADDTGVTDWESFEGEEQIGDEWFAYNVIVRGNNATDEQIHTYCQRQLRQTSDINDNLLGGPNQNAYGTVNGNVSKTLTAYIGDQLHTRPGVLLRNFDANSTNSISMWDITVDGGGLDVEDSPATSTERQFPFVSAGNFNFSQNLVDELDAETRYTAYFEYITTTTAATISISGQTGTSADINWTGTELDHIVVGDYIITSGFAAAENNGEWLVNTVGAGTLNATKQDGINPSDVVAGPSITVLEDPFESQGAVIVNDNGGTPMNGQVSAATLGWDFDYDNNSQGGRSAGSAAPIVVVFQARDGAQWSEASHTITRTVGQNIACNAPDELNYSNP